MHLTIMIYWARRYLRSLYFYGAHDIGYAMQDLRKYSWDVRLLRPGAINLADGKPLILGRNFDFYAGDEVL